MKTQREIEIDAWIAQHAAAKQTAPLAVAFHGKIHYLPVYRLPTKLLIFNVKNGRFASELIEKERELRRKLDPLNSEDASTIQGFLLEQNASETEALTKDLKQNGQLEPGIITADGAVINGNRRMAILKKLYADSEQDRFEYIKVARLPRGVDAKDLWKIEAKLQFGRDFRLEYGPINELLKIRAGKDSGLTPKQISDALGGRYSDKQVEDKLNILKLIDTYLGSIGKPGDYKIIQDERIMEKFNSLHNSVIVPLRKTRHKTTVPKVTEIGFGLIQGNKHSHWKIRELRKITELDAAKKAVLEAYDSNGHLKSAKGIADAFDKASYLVKVQEERDEPEKLADNALSALSQIDAKHEAVATAEFQNVMSEIREQVERLSVRKKSTGAKRH